MFGRTGDPVLNGRLFDQLAEGVIDFDGIEFRGVEIEEIFLRQLFGIEGGLPGWVSPSGSADVESWHNSGDYNLRRLGADLPFVAVLFFLAFSFAFAGPEASGAAPSLTVSSSDLPTVSDAAARPANCGSFCCNLNTGSKRSPIFSTRAKTSFASNTRRAASFFLSACSTSSQLMGVDTVGCSRARRE